jgi:hypothetical protein
LRPGPFTHHCADPQSPMQTREAERRHHCKQDFFNGIKLKADSLKFAAAGGRKNAKVGYLFI